MSSTYDLDQTDPRNVLEAVFYAAQSGDYAILSGLADPAQEGDGDTRSIAEIGSMYLEAPNAPKTQKAIEEFKGYFEKGRTVGEVQYKDSETGPRMARINFLFGPNGEKEEAMQLVERDGKWYLYSF